MRSLSIWYREKRPYLIHWIQYYPLMLKSKSSVQATVMSI